MAIRIIVSMEAAAGKREALIAAFRTLCPSVQERHLNLDALRAHRTVERFTV